MAQSGSVPDGFTLAASGDMIGPYVTMKGINDGGFEQVASLLRDADLAYANQEGAIFDLSTFPGYPSAETGGGYPVSPSAVAGDIRVMGIGVVSKANNHAIDWGMQGLVATLKALGGAGVVQAGAGIGDAQARAPGYVRTPKGTAALVSTASTFPPASTAGPAVTRQGATSSPRPGISPLNVKHIRLVTKDQFEALRKIAGPVGYAAGARGDELRIGDQYFRASPAEGTTVEADPSDKAAVLASIREARKKARFVLFSIHAHETAGDEDDIPPVDFEPMALHRANEAPSPDDPRPAAFLPQLFHEATDAGADAVVRTGPHVLNGIEVHNGKPIFYGLGSLFLSFHGVRGYTAPSGQRKNFPDEWFETVVPVCTYERGRVKEIWLHPMTIESSTTNTDGFPHPADPKHAGRILERVKKMSSKYGTTVSIEGGIGVICP